MFTLSPLIFASAACTHTPLAQREELRRANLELQNVRDMVRSRQIPPVEFEFDSAVLLPESYKSLDKIGEILIKHPTLKLIVEGHCDDIGSDEYNDWLSLERAKAVKSYLVELGVYPDYVKVYGYGKRRPIVYGESDQARALNRRVEFILSTRNWETVF
ncbi:MAG: OmpA family protein [Elusimicrobiaceae bacterium]